MARSSAPRCALCGSPMREELGCKREYLGCVERAWSCPRCLHRMTTEDVMGDGGEPSPSDEKKEDRWQTS